MGIYDQYYSEFPPEIKALDDVEWQELGSIMDNIDAELLEAVTGMKHFWDQDTSEVWMLPFLSYAIRANVYNGDSEDLKRKKIWNAVARHRIKGIEENVFEMIEEIIGVTPAIYSGAFTSFAIWESKNNLMSFPHDFMKWDSKNNVSGGGFRWGSKYSEAPGAYQRGIVYINLNAFPVEPRKIEKVAKAIEYFGAAYFQYHLGYLSDDGWLEYRQIY